MCELWETRTPPFPSPRPSPQRRGRIAPQSSSNPQLLFVPRAELRVSLSPRERAGMRGNEASASTKLSPFFVQGSTARKKFGEFSPRTNSHPSPMSILDLPAVNACLNGLSTIFLTAGYVL